MAAPAKTRRYGKGVYVIGAKEAANHLYTLAEQLTNFSDAYESIGGFYRKQVLAQFEAHGYVPGVYGPWVPLSINTVEHKSRNKFEPLVEYEQLEDSLTRDVSMYSIHEILPMSARFGTSDPVAKFHQGGTTEHGEPHDPARPIVLGNAILDEYIVTAIANHLFRYWIRL